MRKFFLIIASLVLFVTVFASCWGAGKPVTLKFLQYSPEYTDQMHEMGREYHKQFPNVTLDFEILQTDFRTVLKTRFNSGDIPDVFMTSAYNDNKVFADYCYDLTKEPFMKKIYPSALTSVTYKGKILGYPVFSQSYGFIYNKKLFAAAGITKVPKTLSELEAACKKLQAKGIISFSNGYKEWWVFKHVFSHCLAAEEGNYQKTAEELSNGKKKFSDLKTAMQVFKVIDLTLKYGQPKPLETDFNNQIALVANGKAAICTGQGTWAEGGIRKINPDIELGFIGEPVNEDPAKARLMIDSNVIYRIYKDGKNRKEVINWLNWLTTSKYGKNFVSGKIKEISTLIGASAPDAQLAKETSKFLASKETYPWVQGYWPDGFDQQLGSILQAYIAGMKTKDQCIQEINQTWVKLAKAQE